MFRNISDTELLVLLHEARLGSSEALERLLAELYPSMRMHAYRRVQDHRDPEALADDIAQEALLRVIDSMGSCHARSPAALFGWALIITGHAAFDILRSYRLRQAVVCTTPNLDAAAEAASMLEWLSATFTPVSRGTSLLSDALERLLRPLPLATLTVLHLRVQLRMSWAEIAQEIRTTSAGAKRRFQRAQRRLEKDFRSHFLSLPPSDQETLAQRLRYMGVIIPLASPPEESN